MKYLKDLKAALAIYKSLEPALLKRTTQLILDIEKRPESGEWKRHQVYSRLVKEYPTVSKSTLALAIEVAKCSG